MELSTIALVRDRSSNEKMIFVGDNMKIFHEAGQESVLIIDEPNKLAHVIRSSGQYQTGAKPYEMVSFETNTIQFMECNLTSNQVVSTLDKLITDSVITAEEKVALLNNLQIKI